MMRIDNETQTLKDPPTLMKKRRGTIKGYFKKFPMSRTAKVFLKWEDHEGTGDLNDWASDDQLNDY